MTSLCDLKHYAVLALEHERYCAMVLATNHERPTEHLEAIAQDLSALGVAGKVVFDYLLANGTRTRRFFAVEFDGRTFPTWKFERVEGDDQLRAFSAQYFVEHADRVDLALLSPAMRFQVKRGQPV